MLGLRWRTRAARLPQFLAASGSRSSHTPTDGAPATPQTTPGVTDRAYWCEKARRLALPLLRALAARELRARMPIAEQPAAESRARFAHLEALGRLLTGLAPWLELGADE